VPDQTVSIRTFDQFVTIIVLIVSILYDWITSKAPILGFKFYLSDWFTDVFKVNLNSAPILFLVVSTEILTFLSKKQVDIRKNSIYILNFILFWLKINDFLISEWNEQPWLFFYFWNFIVLHFYFFCHYCFSSLILDKYWN
jgi:hypothetical protein